MNVPTDRVIGPRIRCSYCYREKPKQIRTVRKSKYPKKRKAAALEMNDRLDEKAHEVPEIHNIKSKTRKDA